MNENTYSFSSAASKDLSRRVFLQGTCQFAAGAVASLVGSPWARQSKSVWAATPETTTAIVDTANGKVRGAVIGGINVFKGLPYGASTTGANRFMPPQKPQSWSGVREALEFGSIAPQRNLKLNAAAALAASIYSPGKPMSIFAYPREIPEGEDCLVLDVYTPSVADRRPRPVMVWMHGGGFAQGSASAPVYDGKNLARRGDVVVVGINHRLNALGYAYLGELGGTDFAKSGNSGMLDIVQALEWVRDNIEHFGGDPKNVMIFGESGGGSKACTLLAMPCAKGLFHRAAIQSGPGIRSVEREAATKLAVGLLEELDLKPSQVRELQTLPLERIMAAYFARSGGVGMGVRGFAPMVDGDVLPRHPFSPDAPSISADVPILIGYNRTEAEFFLLSDPTASKMTDDDLERRVKTLFSDNSQRVIDLYRKTDPGLNPYELFVLIQTDNGMGVNSIRIAQRKSAAGGAPAYLYNFNWDTPVEGLRSPHTLEIPFVFNNIEIAKGLTGDSKEAFELANKVSDAWVAFARTGNPNSSGLPAWPPYDEKNRATMVIDGESKIVNDPIREKRLLLMEVGRPG
jgi:para-nitrobenzyl esterase